MQLIAEKGGFSEMEYLLQYWYYLISERISITGVIGHHSSNTNLVQKRFSNFRKLGRSGALTGG